ncbi:MAG: diguanylate cyclase [Gemmatimonadota bacterium]|jgi:diguanylate cyclase (GGDEF)-like protein
MTLPTDRTTRSVPIRALFLSLAALGVPVVGALAFPSQLGEYGALLWLLALVPAFLLAYYRGWRGVATALAAGMATLSATQAAAQLLDRSVPDLLLGVVIAYLAIALGIGWVTEMLHQEKDEVEDLAFTDLLTGLPNRRHARVFLENEFAAAQRGRLLAVVLFDLDKFKQYNDRYGHPAGDEALRTFADVLRGTTRRMNLSARFGGEEFLSVLAGSDSEGATVFAERVRTSLRNENLGADALTVSAGVAAYRPGMRSPDALLAAADDALYQAKRDGRNCVRTFASVRSPEEGAELQEASGAEVEPVAAGDGYPRASDELGKSPPPATLLPHQITGFGSGRRVLLVEDEDQVRNLIATYLDREGFSVDQAKDVMTGVPYLRNQYDVVITDIRLPGASGNELVGAVKSRWPETQVIVITGLQDAQVAADALDAGADRYLFKPFGMPELRAHLVDALSRRDRSVAERTERSIVSEEARERAAEARGVVLRGARALVRAVEVRDPYTRGHGRRVASYALELARRVDPDGGLLEPDALRLGCELHDIGKISIPDSILNKPGPLDSEELEWVRKHPQTGRRILEPILDEDLVLSIVSWHHEHWDGSGYPDGLRGETIPLAARVVALADALDAMTSDRAYRRALPWGEAVEQIRARAGTQFDPGLMRDFERGLVELRRIHGARGDESGAREA